MTQQVSLTEIGKRSAEIDAETPDKSSSVPDGITDTTEEYTDPLSHQSLKQRLKQYDHSTDGHVSDGDSRLVKCYHRQSGRHTYEKLSPIGQFFAVFKPDRVDELQDCFQSHTDIRRERSPQERLSDYGDKQDTLTWSKQPGVYLRYKAYGWQPVPIETSDTLLTLATALAFDCATALIDDHELIAVGSSGLGYGLDIHVDADIGRERRSLSTDDIDMGNRPAWYRRLLADQIEHGYFRFFGTPTTLYHLAPEPRLSIEDVLTHTLTPDTIQNPGESIQQTLSQTK